MLMILNILGGSVHNIKKNTEVFFSRRKEIGLKVNADKTKYMIMSRYQNAGRSRNMKIDNSSFENVKELKYLEITLRNQNSIQGEIKSRLKSRNAGYYSMQNLLSSSLLSKNLKIKLYRTIIFLISDFRRDLNIVYFLLGISPASNLTPGKYPEENIQL